MAFLSFDNNVLNLGVQEQEGGLDLHMACCPPALQGKLPPTLLHSGESSSLIQLVASPAATAQPEALGTKGPVSLPQLGGCRATASSCQRRHLWPDDSNRVLR